MAYPIKLNNVSTGYGKTVVTSGIDAHLNSGELTCLLGPNGAGKSTLLKTLSAFLPPISGEILVNGTDIKQLNARKLAKVIGVVLTERPSVMNMTVRELVTIGRSPYTSFLGGLKAADDTIVDEAIASVGIQSLSCRQVYSLSDGERQKAFIAKALAQQTQMIFLDEPTAFLDYPSKVEMMKLLYRLAREEGKTIFMSTHDIEIALQVADKIWLLDRERGLNIGIPEDLAYQGLMAEYFQRGDLKFNQSTCSFEISNPIVDQVCLKGEGALCDMTKRALSRVGIGCDAPQSSGKLIEVTGDAIKYNGKDLTSIEALLYLLHSHRENNS